MLGLSGGGGSRGRFGVVWIERPVRARGRDITKPCQKIVIELETGDWMYLADPSLSDPEEYKVPERVYRGDITRQRMSKP